MSQLRRHDSTAQFDARSANPNHHFPVLDTTRAIGALLVVATHSTFWSGDYLRHGWVGALFARFDVGVAIFFVLSGFLLSRQWVTRAAAAQPPPGLIDYAWKRFLRIYPTYLVGILPALLLVPQETKLTAIRWLTNLTMVDIYFYDSLPLGMRQMWSLQTEVAFYAALPIIMSVALSFRKPADPATADLSSWAQRRMAFVLMGMLAISIGWLVVVLPQCPSIQIRGGFWLPSYLAWFAAGMLIAWAQSSTLATPTRQPPAFVAMLVRLASAPWSCWLIAVGLLCAAATPIAGPVVFAFPTTAQVLTKNILYTLIGFFVVLPGVFAASDTRFAQLMSNRVGRHLGYLSYAIFCIHLPLLSFVYWVTPYEPFTGHGLLIFVIITALSIICAELMYQFLEVPISKLRVLTA